MYQSEQINELVGALSKAQGEMSAAAKDSNNPFFNSKYADLSSVWNACRDALSLHGLAVVQTMQTSESGAMTLVTTLGHSSGQWMRSILPITIKVVEGEVDKHGKPRKVNELQLLGSALTYLRRYALAAIVGVAPDEDDDGNEGGKTTTYAAKPAQKQVAQLAQKQIPQQPVNPKKEEIAPTKEQLLDLLSECDPAYRKMIMKSLEDLKKPIEDLSPERKIALMKAAQIKRDEFQQQMKDLANEGN
jgi:hypothetical protein